MALLIAAYRNYSNANYFYRDFPATSQGAVKPHKNKVGYSGWE
ncbi:hypothetical protein AB99_2141 [Escherichia coli 1-182-04_S3_C1]|nr:hypothetical protein AB99_2141 [Escherichia coli 1-182-04_S3_C1]